MEAENIFSPRFPIWYSASMTTNYTNNSSFLLSGVQHNKCQEHLSHFCLHAHLNLSN